MTARAPADARPVRPVGLGRREVLAALGGAAVFAPFAARAQPASPPVVGFLNSASPGPFAHLVAAFRKGLNEAGYVEGRNVAVEFRWAEGEYERLTTFAGELARRPVSVMVATGGDPAIRAAIAATKTIPIVFAIGSDPVRLGYVTSLNRPGGNVTGVMQLTAMLGAKRIGVLRELVPKADKIAVLVNPNFPASGPLLKDAEEAAARIGVPLVVLNASSDSEFEPAFEKLAAARAAALMVGADPFFNSRRDRIVALAARHKVPAIYEFREFAAAGGLMSYGTSLSDSYQQVGNYAGRILQGARPAELPIFQTSRFEFVINLKVAKELGIEIPPGLSAQADEVIE
jgi:putative ABC transport system substrate-binding protein